MSLLNQGFNVGTSLLSFPFALNALQFDCVSLIINGNTILTNKKVPSGVSFSSFIYNENNKIVINELSFVITKNSKTGLFSFSDLTIIETLRSFQAIIPIVLTTPIFTKNVKIENFNLTQEKGNVKLQNVTFVELPVFNQTDTVTTEPAVATGTQNIPVGAVS